jgi:transposase InsO family protein
MHRNHVWSYDFVMDRTADGRAFWMLTIVDEFTRECLAIDVSRKLTSEDVLERLSDLFVRKGVPDHVRSDNGSEFTATRVREWLERVGVKTLYIEPGSPWENGYVESFNGKLRHELLAREGSGRNRKPIAEQRTATPVSIVPITIPDAFPHLVAVDWRAHVRLKSQPHPAGRDLQDRDHDRRLEILTATDHHTFTILPS